LRSRNAWEVAQNDVPVAVQVLACRPGLVGLDVLHDLVVHAGVKLGVRVGERTRVALVDVLDLGATRPCTGGGCTGGEGEREREREERERIRGGCVWLGWCGGYVVG